MISSIIRTIQKKYNKPTVRETLLPFPLPISSSKEDELNNGDTS